MAKTQINLQDSFLNQVRKDGVPVTIYLVNGVQLRGTVRGFDNFTVILESDGKQLMVYKHAISTITPSRPISQGIGGERRDHHTESRSSGSSANGTCSTPQNNGNRPPS